MSGGEPGLWLILLIGLVAVAVLVGVAFIVLKGAMKPEGETAGEPKPPGNAIAPLPRAEISSSFQSALTSLRERVVGSAFQYRAPWILLAGSPGSGKTAIVESLAAGALGAAGTSSPRGAGVGWGFLNGGVLIDTPGSMLLGPASGIPSDEAAWNQLLRGLARHRPSRPLDGVVLTITAAELLDASADIAARGSLVRARLDELQSKLGLVLPVYVLVTQCDSIPGFTAFCQEAQRELKDAPKEMFGWSNDHTLDSSFTWVWVDEAMTTLQRSIRAWQLRFFGANRDITAPDELFLFPPEFQNLREPLRMFLTQLFIPVSYRDSHYFRGVYFSGLPEKPLPADSKELLPSMAAGRKRLPLFFLEDLFERKIFAERPLARPVPQRFAFRNRIVMGAQIFAVVFSLVMASGLAFDYFRLKSLRDSRIEDAINGVKQDSEQKAPTMDQAYNLVVTLGQMHVQGFSSIFMPWSWNDPIQEEVTQQLARNFRSVVLHAAHDALGRKYQTLLEQTAAEGSAPQPQAAAAEPGENRPAGQSSFVAAMNAGECEGSAAIDSELLTPSADPNYRSLQAYLRELTALEQNIALYDELRTQDGGSAQSLRSLIEYLSGRKLPAGLTFQNNAYFRTAVQKAQFDAVANLKNHRERARTAGEDLANSFLTDWFDNSALLTEARCMNENITRFERGDYGTPPDLRTVAGQIAAMNRNLSQNAVGWIARPFALEAYPPLEQLRAPELQPVFGADPKLMERERLRGDDAWNGLRDNLLGLRAPTGEVLESPSGGNIRVTSDIQTLGANLSYLADLDFMAISQAPRVTASQPPVIWNAEKLDDALKLNASWEKYESQVLPTAPGNIQQVIRQAAGANVGAGLAKTALDARQTSALNLATGDDLDIELKNFNDTLDRKKQLNAAGEKLGKAGVPLMTALDLYREAGRLLAAINARLSGSLYSYDVSALKNWDGSTPLSLALYRADSPDMVAQAVTADHDRIQLLAKYAQPLVELLSGVGLPAGTGTQTVLWSKLGADFKLYADKKPGNPISTLETFLKSDADKITPANQCQAGALARGATDPFLANLNSLRTEAESACLALVRNRYAALADDFRQHLAGRFPFSTDLNAAEADAGDVTAFFNLLDQSGPGLADSLTRLGNLDPSEKAPAQQAVTFLKALAAVRPLFATADEKSLPALDAGVQFRTNEDRESGGRQIIDWELRIGEQTYSYQAPPKTLRWHYGDAVTLTLRYAKDSLEVPVALRGETDAAIGNRLVVYQIRKNWSLLALLIGHAAAATDFDNPLAPIPNTVRLHFGNAPAYPDALPAGKKPVDTLVFASFTLQAPASKEGAARTSITLSSFPVQAPVFPAQRMATE